MSRFLSKISFYKHNSNIKFNLLYNYMFNFIQIKIQFIFLFDFT